MQAHMLKHGVSGTKSSTLLSPPTSESAIGASSTNVKSQEDSAYGGSLNIASPRSASAMVTPDSVC